MNLPSLIILAVVAALVFLALRSMRRGKASGCCEKKDCSGCALGADCHIRQKEESKD